MEDASRSGRQRVRHTERPSAGTLLGRRPAAGHLAARVLAEVRAGSEEHHRTASATDDGCAGGENHHRSRSTGVRTVNQGTSMNKHRLAWVATVLLGGCVVDGTFAAQIVLSPDDSPEAVVAKAADVR